MFGGATMSYGIRICIEFHSRVTAMWRASPNTINSVYRWGQLLGLTPNLFENTTVCKPTSQQYLTASFGQGNACEWKANNVWECAWLPFFIVPYFFNRVIKTRWDTARWKTEDIPGSKSCEVSLSSKQKILPGFVLSSVSLEVKDIRLCAS